MITKSTNSPDYLALRAALADVLAEEWERLVDYLERRLRKADEPGNLDELDQALDEYDYRPLGQRLQAPSVTDPLASAYRQGIGRAEAGLGFTWNLPDSQAIAYARARAAEMVGLSRLPDGRLVANPDARWRITDETRDRLREMVYRVGEEPGLSYRNLRARIEELPGFDSLFGEARAETIARTELALAANAGTLAHFERSGADLVRVLDNPNCPTCAPFAGTVQTLAWAREHPLGHPNCIRAFVSAGQDVPAKTVQAG